MLIRNVSDIIHRWRQPNNTYLVWAPGQVRDIPELDARAIGQGHPDKMCIVTYFSDTDTYEKWEPPAETGDGEGPPSITTVTSEGVPTVGGDAVDLLAAANVQDAAVATEDAKPSRKPRRSRQREGSGNG